MCEECAADDYAEPSGLSVEEWMLLIKAWAREQKAARVSGKVVKEN